MKNTRNQLSLTEGNVIRVLLRFTVPFLLANLLQALYGAVDLLAVGMFCGAQSIAAVSTGTQVTQMITSLISGLTLGGTVLVGKYIGMKKEERARKAIGTTIVSFGIFALILTAAMAGNASAILRLLAVPEASFAEARAYVVICSLGSLFLCEYNAVSAVLRGWGDSVSPLLCIAAACLCNVAGDFYLVGALHMGAAGTAAATVLSQAVSMFFAVFFLRRKNAELRLSRADFIPGKGMIRELALIGVPVSFQECMVRFSFLYLTAIINGFGVYAASAVGIAGKYDVFAMLPATSAGSALAALTAQNAGAGKKERAAEFLRWGTLFSLAAASLFFLWAQAAPATMLGIFSRDPEVIRAGTSFLRSCSLDYLAVALLFCANGYLNGLEKTVFTMLNCCAGALLIRVPLLALLTRTGAQSLLLYGMVSPFSSAVMLSVLGAYEARGRRRRKKGGVSPAASAASRAESGKRERRRIRET